MTTAEADDERTSAVVVVAPTVRQRTEAAGVLVGNTPTDRMPL